MNPGPFIAPSNALGLPAPYWFIVIFKVLGFSLHAAFMNIWYAGPIIALILWFRGGRARNLTKRLIRSMPIIIAYGVNFGIVPLLFLQVAYYKAFYPSTILMAWPWFSVIVLLTFAYYGIYIYATGFKEGVPELNPWRQVAGWIAAIFFIIIGFIFSNEFSLLTNLGNWKMILQLSNFSGAVYGTALNAGDPTLWPRWLMMFGLAITTTSAFVAVDTGLFAWKEGDEYKKWASSFIFKLYSIGILWYAAAGLWYVFGTWPLDNRHYMFSGPILILTVLTAMAPGLPWLLLTFVARTRGIGRSLAVIIGTAQFGVIAINAVSRQIVQNVELGKYMDITREKVNIQWSPLLVFLVLFAGGIALVIWMVRQAAKSGSGTVTNEAIG
jgi:hypothetical protein